MCGFFFGQTPLIVLSPRKTVEGYLGGGLATMVLGLLMMMATTMVLLMVNVMLVKISILRRFQKETPDLFSTRSSRCTFQRQNFYSLEYFFFEVYSIFFRTHPRACSTIPTVPPLSNVRSHPDSIPS